MADEIIELGIPVFDLHKSGKIDLSVISKISDIIKSCRIDLVHTHMFTANLWGRLASMLSGRKPVVITEHNMDIWKRFPESVIDKTLLPSTKKILYVSNGVRSFYETKMKMPVSKGVVCHNGLDIERLASNKSRQEAREALGMDGASIVVGAVGRLVPQKRFDLFLEALSRASFERKGLVAIIVGDGPERENLVSQRNKLGLSGSVKFLGLINDMGDIYKTMDLLAVSSDREGLSISMLEAMSLGVPIVATDVGGNSECVIDGVTGMIVPPNDSHRLGQAIVQMAGDVQKLKEMGDAAERLFQERFTVDKMVRRHEEIYLEIASSANMQIRPPRNDGGATGTQTRPPRNDGFCAHRT
ncbi:MAG: glycosyltransferase, partial [Candidatus Omnitrophota bacterium]